MAVQVLQKQTPRVKLAEILSIEEENYVRPQPWHPAKPRVLKQGLRISTETPFYSIPTAFLIICWLEYLQLFVRQSLNRAIT